MEWFYLISHFPTGKGRAETKFGKSHLEVADCVHSVPFLPHVPVHVFEPANLSFLIFIIAIIIITTIIISIIMIMTTHATVPQTDGT